METSVVLFVLGILGAAGVVLSVGWIFYTLAGIEEKKDKEGID